MATTFNYNGATFTIIEGSSDVQLNRISCETKELILPKNAVYLGKTYNVTEIECPWDEKYEWINKETDGRRRPRYERVVKREPCNVLGKAYYNKAEVESIIIPDGIKKIGEFAFYGLRKLKYITISKSVTHIGQYAFEYCRSLESVDIPEGVTKIRNDTFSNCANLRRVSIPNTVTKLCSCSFGWCPSLEELKIYAEPHLIEISDTAIFPSNPTITYLAKPQLPKHSQEKRQIDLDKLIDAVIIDGVVTDKERAVILKKASAAGYDADDVEILLDARVYEKQDKENQKKKSATLSSIIEGIAKAKEAEKTNAAEEAVSVKEISQQDSCETDSKFPYGDKVWQPVKACLASNNVDLKAPKTSQNWIVFKLKSIDAQIVLAYNPGKNVATVQLETMSGDPVKSKLDAKIALTAADHIIRTAEVEQSKRNKNKWVWAMRANIDKNDTHLVKWYADVMIDIYRVIEG